MLRCARLVLDISQSRGVPAHRLLKLTMHVTLMQKMIKQPQESPLQCLLRLKSRSHLATGEKIVTGLNSLRDMSVTLACLCYFLVRLY